MKIQSLSIVVPNKKCWNDCEFCVSKMHADDYKNMMDENLPFYDLYEADYIKRLAFARDNGCNVMMITGDSEPQQNKMFLQRLGTMNRNLPTPFRHIEIQTTGTGIDDPYLRFLRNHVGVNTISVSISSFDDEVNRRYCNMPSGKLVELKSLCSAINKYDFNLRLSINLTDAYEDFKPWDFFKKAKELGADQVTFRVLYQSPKKSPQNDWIAEHAASKSLVSDLKYHVELNGRELEVLEYGAIKYSVNGLSTVIDSDCMSTEPKVDVKYLVLRPNCKLYTKWDDRASLLF